MEIRKSVKSGTIKMELPTNPEYVAVARLTVSAISNMIGFNIEDIEDIKIALSEACSNAIRHSQRDLFQLNFEIGMDKLGIEVTDDGVGCVVEHLNEPDLNDPKEGGLGLFIIRSLMDDVCIESGLDKGTRICMTKFLEEGK